jgi:F0F1-type ATP synthase assembly protein I
LAKQNQQGSDQDPTDKKPKDGGDRLRDYAKYSGMAIQMGIIILVGTLIGQKLDEYFQLQRPYLTVLFALLSIFTALYIVLKDLFTSEDKKRD